jgi:putative oxidoreductase
MPWFPFKRPQQAPWIADVPVALVRFIGIAELAGALGLVLPAAFRVAPQLTVAAAIGLAVIMVLAAAFHVARGEASMTGMPVAVTSVLALIAWGRLRKAPIPTR